jgi:hypothetical protein
MFGIAFGAMNLHRVIASEYASSRERAAAIRR